MGSLTAVKPKGISVPEVDEDGNATDKTGTVQIVNPVDGESSFLEFTDSEGGSEGV